MSGTDHEQSTDTEDLVDDEDPLDGEEPTGGEHSLDDEDALDGEDPLDDEDLLDEESRTGPTPRQARRLRVALACVGMAVMAAVLAVRLASRTSLLVVADYGLALVLCGVVIELSRNGRTRLGTWLLCVGLTAAVMADWLLLP